MTKFQKIQKISSIIPFWSTVFVALITMYELKKRNASAKMWLYFVLTYFLSGIFVYVLNTVIMTGQHPFLNVLASGLILAAANILFVDLQVLSVQQQHHRDYTTKKKRIVIYIVTVVAAVASIIVLLVLLLEPSVDIGDINGSEDTSLAVIKIEEILSTDEHFSAFGSYMSKNGANTEVTGFLKNYDHDEIIFRCQKISGIKTLHATKTMCDQLSLEIDSQLEIGNMEIIIMIEGEYYDHIAVDQASSIILTGISGKTVTVKIAAESAKVNIAINRSVNY